MIMFAQSDAFFTGQVVFALTAILGLGSIAVKLLGRRSSDQQAVSGEEFREFRQETVRQLELVRQRMDAAVERLLARIDEHHAQLLQAHETRSHGLQAKISELQSQVARLDERTK